MNAPTTEYRVKRLWLVLGFIAVSLLLLGLYSVNSELIGARGRDGEAVVVSPPNPPATDLVPRAVRFGFPELIKGTNTQIILVRFGAEYEESVRGSGEGAFSVSRGSDGGRIVNVMVLPSGEGRLIFDRPVYIDGVSYPGSGSGSDSLQTWIAYEVVLDDSNRDGQLDRSDAGTLYVSDLNGLNLRRALPEGWHLLSHETMPDHRTLVVSALRRPVETATEWNADQATQRMFLYDVAAGQMRSFATVDSLAARAGAILGAPRRKP